MKLPEAHFSPDAKCSLASQVALNLHQRSLRERESIAWMADSRP